MTRGETQESKANAGDHSWEWDVFISYAREDSATATEFYSALDKFVTKDGAAPRVYFDTSRTGTPVGADWRDYLDKAIRNSRFFVALYSQTYFKKEVCEWELDLAGKLELGSENRFFPINIDQVPINEAPYHMRKFNVISMQRIDWMDEVRRALELWAPETCPVLRFATPVTDVFARNMLPPVTVTGAVPEGEAPWPPGEAVTISSDPPASGLTGTLTRLASANTAVFSDLAFHEVATSVRLIATSPGCREARTPPFAVRPPDEQPPPADGDSQRPPILTRGNPVFFPDGEALAIYEQGSLTVHAAERKAVATAGLEGTPRLWARGDCFLAVADWSGRVILAAPDGVTRVADIPPARAGHLNVPGALAFDRDTLYVGMWNGTVWRVSLDTVQPEQVLDHPAGIQVLLAGLPGLLIGDLAGKLTRYQEDQPAASHALEPMLLAITRVANFALVVGEHQIHRLDLATGQLLQVTQPVAEIASAVPSGDLTTIMDAHGQCVSFDVELAVRSGFQTVPGSRLAGSGAGGQLLVLEHPDGTYALVRDSRTRYTSRYPMAVSPDARQVAVSNGERLLVLAPGDLGGAVKDDSGKAALA